MRTDYLTKDQLETVMAAWGISEPLPTKGKKVVVSWPKPSNPSLAEITRHNQKSVYGKPLYKVVFS